jgi:hypothetical protein
MHFVEDSTGTCGAIPDQIINIGQDGTVANGASITCDKKEIDGCTAKNSGCTSTTASGLSCMLNSDVTYAQDGGSASGLETITCTSGGSTCSSTYSVTAARQ